MKKYIVFSIFCISLLIAISTRYYKLGQAPAGLYIDEAAQGYNAYSILQTGKDEFGKGFPIVFRSFTDFKTPVYVYLIVPLIPVFGLTPFTVRLPSFIFSILTLPILYLLIKRLAPKKNATILALCVSLMLAISPWHILFGRTNFECNVALFFFLTGVYFFYFSLEKPWMLVVSAFFFAFAIPAYHSQRIITPLILLVLTIKERKIIFSKTHLKYLLISGVLGFIISLPTLSVITTPGFLARAAGLNIFSHIQQQPAGFIENYHGPFGWLINSSIFLSTREFSALYISYFSPRNMFLLGDYGPRSSFPTLATFFVWQFPFYIWGLYILFKEKSLGNLRFFAMCMLFISPIPAAVTRDPYSTIRSLPMVIPQLIVISLGIVAFFDRIVHKEYKIASIAVSILIIIYSLAKVYSAVIVHNEYYRASAWDYGWKEVAQDINSLDKNLPIVVDNSRYEPYSQLLFFLKYDPQIYQAQNFEVPLSEYYTNMQRDKTKIIGNITTRPINWEKDLLIDQYLIGDYLSISDNQIHEHNLELISDVKYPDGSMAFRIVRVRRSVAFVPALSQKQLDSSQLSHDKFYLKR